MALIEFRLSIIINFIFGRVSLAFENLSKCYTYFMILKTKL